MPSRRHTLSRRAAVAARTRLNDRAAASASIERVEEISEFLLELLKRLQMTAQLPPHLGDAPPLHCQALSFKSRAPVIVHGSVRELSATECLCKPRNVYSSESRLFASNSRTTRWDRSTIAADSSQAWCAVSSRRFEPFNTPSTRRSSAACSSGEKAMTVDSRAFAGGKCLEPANVTEPTAGVAANPLIN